MEANELRIGNIIGLKDGTVFQLSLEAMSSPEFWKKLPSLFQPIPLTTETLTRMGFDEKASNVFVFRTQEGLEVRMDRDVFEIITDGRPILKRSFSIHKFQNLIYELTGIELNIADDRDELREAIEMVADSVLYKYIPADRSEAHLAFELVIEGETFLVNYSKDEEGFWKFRDYTKS